MRINTLENMSFLHFHNINDNNDSSLHNNDSTLHRLIIFFKINNNMMMTTATPMLRGIDEVDDDKVVGTVVTKRC